jgi:hypothetical protein
MNKEELEKYIDLEIQWLNYYANEETRTKLNENSEIYRDLKSIGYTKRVLKLDSRCCPCTITSDEIITEGTDLSVLRKHEYNIRGENKLSPIETYITIFPKKKMEILNRLIYKYKN